MGQLCAESTKTEAIDFKTSADRFEIVNAKSSVQKCSLRAGFEPAREDPIGFQVQRLNHSAITALHLRHANISNIPLLHVF